MMETWKRTCLAVGVVAFVLALIGGCGKPLTGEVSGKVTFRGEPVTAGTIAFVGADGRVTSGMIEGGSYHLVKVPLGSMRITVFAAPASLPIVPLEMIKNGTASPPRPPQKKPAPIPKRYQDAQQSNLAYTVVPGKQCYDIAMQP